MSRQCSGSWHYHLRLLLGNTWAESSCRQQPWPIQVCLTGLPVWEDTASGYFCWKVRFWRRLGLFSAECKEVLEWASSVPLVFLACTYQFPISARDMLPDEVAVMLPNIGNSFLRAVVEFVPPVAISLDHTSLSRSSSSAAFRAILSSSSNGSMVGVFAESWFQC